MATKTTEKPKRTPDAFQLARSIYLARKRLFAKANQLIADAPVDVASLVEAHEEADSRQTIAELPSSPNSSAVASG